MKVLFDSNLWISFMIGKRLSSLADVLCHHDIEVYISEQQLDDNRSNGRITISNIIMSNFPLQFIHTQKGRFLLCMLGKSYESTEKQELD